MDEGHRRRHLNPNQIQEDGPGLEKPRSDSGRSAQGRKGFSHRLEAGVRLQIRMTPELLG